MTTYTQNATSLSLVNGDIVAPFVLIGSGPATWGGIGVAAGARVEIFGATWGELGISAGSGATVHLGSSANIISYDRGVQFTKSGTLVNRGNVDASRGGPGSAVTMDYTTGQVPDASLSVTNFGFLSGGAGINAAVTTLNVANYGTITGNSGIIWWGATAKINNAGIIVATGPRTLTPPCVSTKVDLI
jgi:hypothetical protein